MTEAPKILHEHRTRVGTIQSSWLALANGNLSARYWIGVLDYMAEHGLARDDAGVKAAIAGMFARDNAAKATAKDLRAQAAALIEQARALEKGAER